MVEDLVDPRRVEPPFVLDERSMLDGWLEFHRWTLRLKCEGLDADALRARPVPTSDMSLHGLVRHMAEVERGWFQRVLLREPDLPHIWRTPDRDDADWKPLDNAVWSDDLDAWERECDESRRVAAPLELDHTGLRKGNPCSLRWIYNHMIEEYARHNGHADLIRELVDGAVGW
jgi:uncharacterized damage-inducible protein DinB